MKQWDRERHLVMDAKKEDAINTIRYDRREGVSDEKIRKRLDSIFKLSPSTIDELFAQVDAESPEPNTK